MLFDFINTKIVIAEALLYGRIVALALPGFSEFSIITLDTALLDWISVSSPGSSAVFLMFVFWWVR